MELCGYPLYKNNCCEILTVGKYCPKHRDMPEPDLCQVCNKPTKSKYKLCSEHSGNIRAKVNYQSRKEKYIPAWG